MSSTASWRVRIPPPTVNGMNTVSATRRTISSMIARPSWLAVISRKTNSSAPSVSYRAATATGSPASTSSRNLVPFTTRPFSTSRHGIIRFANISTCLQFKMTYGFAQTLDSTPLRNACVEFVLQEMHIVQPYRQIALHEPSSVDRLHVQLPCSKGRHQHQVP